LTFAGFNVQAKVPCDLHCWLWYEKKYWCSREKGLS